MTSFLITFLMLVLTFLITEKLKNLVRLRIRSYNVLYDSKNCFQILNFSEDRTDDH